MGVQPVQAMATLDWPKATVPVSCIKFDKPVRLPSNGPCEDTHWVMAGPHYKLWFYPWESLVSITRLDGSRERFSPLANVVYFEKLDV